MEIIRSVYELIKDRFQRQQTVGSWVNASDLSVSGTSLVATATMALYEANEAVMVVGFQIEWSMPVPTGDGYGIANVYWLRGQNYELVTSATPTASPSHRYFSNTRTVTESFTVRNTVIFPIVRGYHVSPQSVGDRVQVRLQAKGTEDGADPTTFTITGIRARLLIDPIDV